MNIVGRTVREENSGGRSDSKKYRIHVQDPPAAEKISQALQEKLAALSGRDIDGVVLLCIGTDRSTGDCLGPLVGSQLSASEQDFFTVYGTLEQPVHAANLESYLDLIKQTYRHPLIIAVDACLGSTDNIGYINICDGPLRPGAGVNKSLPAVGDIYITGIVNVGGFMEYLVLQNTRLNLVMQMSRLLAQGLCQTAAEYSRQRTGYCSVLVNTQY
ncbi:MAG: spore protease YyaC [Firmicutes bacterium]|nr:spore protease YyaC [Bacillota bacterium]